MRRDSLLLFIRCIGKPVDNRCNSAIFIHVKSKALIVMVVPAFQNVRETHFVKIAIIGAGMAGLTCATRLARLDHDVALFDKGRGAGGRMAVRRIDTGGGEITIDHGAPFFRAVGLPFAATVNSWVAGGHVARWPAAGRDGYVGIPAMNGPLKAMADALDVQWNVRIETMMRGADGWTLQGEGTPGTVFDAVVVAVPAEQAGPLLSPHDPAMARAAMAVTSAPCWTAMAVFAAPVPRTQSILRDRGALRWAIRNSDKPQRAAQESWVLQASARWSRDHLEYPAQDVASMLLQEFAGMAQGSLPEVLALSAHRWRYSQPESADGSLCLWNSSRGIGACGDWLSGDRVEDAWLSGNALAAAIAGVKP